ncbi:MAG: helix-turn-helix domain-containing protein [Clostridiales bacterium]|jgi:transcriptional regulator with XRE-family HTH domain|nr:helix-turn-helix domain-containing protein [Clostridiales bacterium]
MEQTKFGQRIKELRKEHGLTQESIANEFKIHRTTVKDWEVQGKEPNYLTLCRIAIFFGVTTDYLLGLED